MPESLFNGPRRRTLHLRPEVAIVRALTILAVFAVVAALYFAKPILVPLAIATLLTFVLAPPMRLLRNLGLGRVPAVTVVVLGAFLLIFGIGSFLGQQVTELAKQLPQYQYVIQSKIQGLSAATSGSILERLSGLLDRLNRQLTSKQAPGSNPEPQGEGSPAPAPVPVEIHQPAPSPIDVAGRVLSPALNVFATAGLVVIFVIFFLLQRRDLRDRIIRIAGSHDLGRTTEALDDAGQRLSRYFLAQTALNALFGVIVAVGLAVIGVPNPMLWGVLSMVLRFVPYIGAIISAAFPTALAIAVSPDWTMALWTIGLFIVIEPLIGQVLEPLLYGHSTGLSPVAVILAATFWTWLWGPIGLLLSTPVTVCLAVLGRHIDGLEFVEVLIGRQAPLSPPQRFYQRALAEDINEVTDQAEEMLKNISLLEYYDGVVLPGLVLAQIDFARGVLDRSHIEGINEVMEELVDELSDHEDGVRSTQREGAASKEARAKGSRAGTGERSRPEWLPEDCGIACLWGRGPFDKALATVLAQLLEKHGLKPQVGSGAEASNVIRLGSPEVKLVCFSSLHIGRSSTRIRYSVRRMRDRFAQAKVLLCLWGEDLGELVGHERAGDRDADGYAASFKDALDCLRSEECLDEAAGFDAVGPGAA
jgi:predicted PurR-regulated permease PerM